jgi:hypothetical protein
MIHHGIGVYHQLGLIGGYPEARPVDIHRRGLDQG